MTKKKVVLSLRDPVDVLRKKFAEARMPELEDVSCQRYAPARNESRGTYAASAQTTGSGGCDVMFNLKDEPKSRDDFGELNRRYNGSYRPEDPESDTDLDDWAVGLLALVQRQVRARQVAARMMASEPDPLPKPEEEV